MLFYFHPGDLGLSNILFMFLTLLFMAFAVLIVPVFFIYRFLKSRKIMSSRQQLIGTTNDSSEDKPLSGN